MSMACTDPFSKEAVCLAPAVYPQVAAGSKESPEGMLSWTVRLAQAHCVGPRTMLRQLLSSHAQYREIWSGSTFFERDSGTVNGLGSYARMMVDLFSEAHASAEVMTLLPLAHLLPRNGEGLLVKRPRWCPACLCEQVRAQQPIHFPLAWSLEYYRVCHVHRTVMSEHCPACGAQQDLLPCYPSLVHCTTCGEPLLAALGEQDRREEPEPTPFEAWCSLALMDLIAQRALLQTEGSLAQFRANISALVEKFSPNNRKGLCEAVGLQIYALNGWLNKNERPSLAVLLRLCHGVGLLPSGLFLPNAVARVGNTQPRMAPASQRHNKPLLGYRTRERIQKQLEVILADPSDHRGLAEVARQVGLTRHALKYWFRHQASEIVRKKRVCEDRSLARRYQEQQEFLRAVVQQLTIEGVYPSKRCVNAALEKYRTSLMRPDLFEVYQRVKMQMLAQG